MAAQANQSHATLQSQLIQERALWQNAANAAQQQQWQKVQSAAQQFQYFEAEAQNKTKHSWSSRQR